MDPTPNLDFLRDRVNKLKKLLDDPHPDLFTWRQMLQDRMDEITGFWTGTCNSHAAGFSKSPND
jgi:hypothetical protein